MLKKFFLVVCLLPLMVGCFNNQSNSSSKLTFDIEQKIEIPLNYHDIIGKETKVYFMTVGGNEPLMYKFQSTILKTFPNTKNRLFSDGDYKRDGTTTREQYAIRYEEIEKNSVIFFIFNNRGSKGVMWNCIEEDLDRMNQIYWDRKEMNWTVIGLYAMEGINLKKIDIITAFLIKCDIFFGTLNAFTDYNGNKDLTIYNLLYRKQIVFSYDPISFYETNPESLIKI